MEEGWDEKRALTVLHPWFDFPLAQKKNPASCCWIMFCVCRFYFEISVSCRNFPIKAMTYEKKKYTGKKTAAAVPIFQEWLQKNIYASFFHWLLLPIRRRSAAAAVKWPIWNWISTTMITKPFSSLGESSRSPFFQFTFFRLALAFLTLFPYIIFPLFPFCSLSFFFVH